MAAELRGRRAREGGTKRESRTPRQETRARTLLLCLRRCEHLHLHIIQLHLCVPVPVGLGGRHEARSWTPVGLLRMGVVLPLLLLEHAPPLQPLRPRPPAHTRSHIHIHIHTLKRRPPRHLDLLRLPVPPRRLPSSPRHATSPIPHIHTRLELSLDGGRGGREVRSRLPGQRKRMLCPR